MSNAKKELLEEIANSQEVIEFRKIERLILNDSKLHEKINRLFEVQKQAVNAKEFGLENAYFEYKKEYQEILKSLEENVLFNQYLSLKKDAKEIMKLSIAIIENEIYKKINN